MSKSTLIVCGILAAVSLIKTTAIASQITADATPVRTHAALVNHIPNPDRTSVGEIARATIGTSAADETPAAVEAGPSNWLNHLSGAEPIEPSLQPTATAAIIVPSPVSALLLVGGLSVAFGGRRRQPGLVSRRDTPKFKVVKNHATRTEACMVRLHRTGVLTRRSNPMVARA